MIPVPSGILTLNESLPLGRAESGGPAYAGSIGAYSVYTDLEHPNTGNKIQGWQWDKRTWSGERDDNVVSLIPSNFDATTSGVTQAYFQSGIGDGDDLLLQGIVHLPSSGLNSAGVLNEWAPKINHGYYYDYEDENYLYSDDSEIVYLTCSGVAHSGFNKVGLLSKPKVGVPVSVVRYSWDNEIGKYSIALKAQKKIHFTGELQDDNTRLETWDDRKGIIIWDNIDDTYPEFIVLDSGVTPTTPEVIMNGQFCDVYPSLTTYEELGYSTGTPTQTFYTTFSPIDSSMPINVVSYVTATGVITTWSGIPSSGILTSGLYQVKVDYDLGILEFGVNVSGVLPSGINAPSGGDTVAVRYYPSMKVEYEPEESNDYIIAHEVTLNPVYRQQGRGFVYLQTAVQDPASITLSADLPVLGTDVFGPVYLGNTVAPLIATVFDSQGDVIEGQTVTFFITSDPAPGSFGSTGDSTTARTNLVGQARAYYTPPASIDEIGEYVEYENYSTNSSPTEPAGATHTTTLRTTNLLIQGDLSDISVYQVLINDASQGWLDPSLDPTDTEAQEASYLEKWFYDEQLYGRLGLVSSGVNLSIVSSGVVTSGAVNWEITHREAWDLLRPTIFDTSEANGKKVLASVLDATAINPHTFTAGAVAPFRPSLVNSAGDNEYDLVFDTTVYRLPPPTASQSVAPAGILHSYFVVAPTSIEIQASVYNERRGVTILSNTIQLRVNVPPYLNGTWTIDAINETHISEILGLVASGLSIGQKVPLGFRLRSTNITLAAAVNGVTFLDVNPDYNAQIWDEDQVAGSGVHVGHSVYVSGVHGTVL